MHRCWCHFQSSTAGKQLETQEFYDLLWFFSLFKWDNALHHNTCRVLTPPVSMTLAPGRIEWSFRLSVAVWPICPPVERWYVCDNTGLYGCADGCWWSRSWQRRREIKRREGRDGRLVGCSGLQERETSFLLDTVSALSTASSVTCRTLSSSQIQWRMFISDIYSFLLPTRL